MSVRVFGLSCGRRAWIITVVTLLAGLVWLAQPILWSSMAGSRADGDAEAPLMTMLLVLLLALGWIGLWIDSGRDTAGLGLAVAATAINIALRPMLNAGHGIEVNHVLPMIAGAAGGGPVGFLVGATSCVLSQFSLNLMGPPMPGQIVVWGLAGMLGGLVHRLRPIPAWGWCIILSLLFGPVSGVLLNLIGWPTEPQETTSSFFFPGLPASVNAMRLLTYTRQTSLGYDMTRGITTAIGVLVVGLPILTGLRNAWSPRATASAVTGPVPPDLSERARDRRRIDHVLDDHWAAPPPEPFPVNENDPRPAEEDHA